MVMDGGREPRGLAQTVEHARPTGAVTRLLLVVEPRSAWRSSGCRCALQSDFLVRGASSDELAVRVRSLLWPGEEVTKQELIRIDDLTVNLATYQAYCTVSRSTSRISSTRCSRSSSRTRTARTRREVLLRRVWGSDYYGGSRTVDVHVRRIRSKIGAGTLAASRDRAQRRLPLGNRDGDA